MTMITSIRHPQQSAAGGRPTALPTAFIRRACLCLALLSGFVNTAVWAAEYRLVVKTAREPGETVKIFTSLASYLQQKTGHKVIVVSPVSFFAHWRDMRRGKGYDLVLDAAHFTGYRVRKLDYEILAKVSGVLSFSIVTGEDNLIFESAELIGQPVAALASPALGAVQLGDIFPDPIRTPRFLEVDNTEAAVAKLLSGEAAAAVIPTPLVSSFAGLNVVSSTAQLPAVAISASPAVPGAHRLDFRRALLEAAGSDAGRAMLERINVQGFEPAAPEQYREHALLLRAVWGY